MNVYAKRSLGQHFLRDGNMIAKIIRAVAPQEGERILEIGPGPGALTFPLIRSGARITVLELDRRFASRWKEEEERHPHLRCVEGDALTADWQPYLPCDKLVSNIPYNISRPLIHRIFAYRNTIGAAYLTVQKEFADKLLAAPGDRTYGIISVLSALLCRPEFLFHVPPEVFTPPPRVNSAFLKLRFIRPETDEQRLTDIVGRAFAQRRKRLRNSLQELYRTSGSKDFPWNERADTLPPEAYLRLLSAGPSAGN